jgi:hypothetical protein
MIAEHAGRRSRLGRLEDLGATAPRRAPEPTWRCSWIAFLGFRLLQKASPPGDGATPRADPARPRHVGGEGPALAGVVSQGMLEGGGTPALQFGEAQNGQLPGAGITSIRRVAFFGMNWTTTVFATAPLSSRMMWTSPPPMSTNAFVPFAE